MDSMLGSLARKLRLYGLDAEYEPRASDQELLSRARDEGRVLISSDRALVARAKRLGVAALLVEAGGDAEALAQVFLGLGLRPEGLSPDRARCSRCNGEVARASKRSVRDKVAPRTFSAYSAFYICRRCGKVYWEGAHWRRILALHGRVLKLLAAARSRPTL